MSRKPAIIIGAVAVIAVLGGYLYIYRDGGQAAAPGSGAAAAVTERGVPVTTAKAVRQPVEVALEVIGAVEAYASVGIKSRVDGELLAAGFREGDRVRKGDLLFSIDPRSFEAQLRQAEANLARDQAQVAQAKADLSRYTGLSQRGVATQQQYEAAKAAVAGLTGTIAADAAAIDMAKLQLEYTSILAPIDGRTGDLLISTGNLVKANDTEPIVVINQTQPIYVTFSVAEQHLTRVKERFAAGDDVRVTATIPSDPDRPEQGRLTFINNAVDRSTGTIQLKGTFENADDRLTPGQFVRVALAMSTLPEALVVPSQAVQTGQDGLYVFVVKADKTVEARPVVLGPTVQGATVIEDGLQAGEEVVTEGQLRLAPGKKVEIKAPAAGTTS
jgi:membrane fusion protein, multidrug efflux system